MTLCNSIRGGEEKKDLKKGSYPQTVSLGSEHALLRIISEDDGQESLNRLRLRALRMVIFPNVFLSLSHGLRRRADRRSYNGLHKNIRNVLSAQLFTFRKMKIWQAAKQKNQGYLKNKKK